MKSVVPQRAIEQMAPSLGEEEKRAVAAYLESGGWLTEFEKTAEFERMIADFTGAKYAVVVNSGTSALYCMMVACGVKAGDEVIVPDFTMIATANAVLLAGARPVLVDVDRSALCIDVDAAERAITPRTRAIVAVSLNGRSPDMGRLQSLCAKHRLLLLEDAAQSLGSCRGGKHLGTFGDAGVLSFSPLKVVTTGQGGAVITDDPEIAAKARRVKDFGRDKGGVDFHPSIGFNFKFTDLQAVIGIEQMKKLPARLRRKKEMFALYREELRGVAEVEFVDTNLQDVAPWFIDVLLDRRDELASYLRDQGAKTRPFYPAIHAQPAYGVAGDFPETARAAARGLWLPSSAFLTDDEVRTVTRLIRKFFHKD